VAVTFVDWDDMPKWGLINKALDLPHPEPVETYSSSKHLYSDLSIPVGTTGKLPRASRTRVGLDAEELEDVGETGRKPKRSDAGRGDRAGGRDGDRSGGRAGGRDERPAREEEAGPALPKRTGGTRRRTRGGGATADAPEAATSSAPAEGGDARPRRRRGGRGRGGGEASAAE
ncbi:MAG: hypothetical protein ABR614_01440, partial [Mycobacteriales bacterium]